MNEEIKEIEIPAWARDTEIEVHNDNFPLREVNQSLATISNSLATIAGFLEGKKLTEVVEGYALMQAAGNMLSGLAANGGRQALDARTISQNATEIAHIITQTVEKLRSHLTEKFTNVPPED